MERGGRSREEGREFREREGDPAVYGVPQSDSNRRVVQWLHCAGE